MVKNEVLCPNYRKPGLFHQMNAVCKDPALKNQTLVCLSKSTQEMIGMNFISHGLKLSAENEI